MGFEDVASEMLSLHGSCMLPIWSFKCLGTSRCIFNSRIGHIASKTLTLHENCVLSFLDIKVHWYPSKHFKNRMGACSN